MKKYVSPSIIVKDVELQCMMVQATKYKIQNSNQMDRVGGGSGYSDSYPNMGIDNSGSGNEINLFGN